MKLECSLLYIWEPSVSLEVMESGRYNEVSPTELFSLRMGIRMGVSMVPGA